MAPVHRILVIEDEADLAGTLIDFLDQQGFETDLAEDGLVGLHLACCQDYDALLLDLGLPGIEGLDLCRRLRQDGRSDVPILMITARDTIDDRVTGFGAGADDYLVKPFSLRELEARIRSLIRRAAGRAKTILRVADLTFNTETLEVERGGQRLHLTRTERAILKVLMEASPAVVMTADLETAVWHHTPPSPDTVRSHIHGVRRAIDGSFEPALLQTVHGVGHRVCKPKIESP